MVSDQEIASCVESLLRQSDPAVAAAVSAGAGAASLSGVVRQVEAKLGGVDLSHKAAFIRDQIDLLLGPHRPPAPATTAHSPAAGAPQILLHHPMQQIPPTSSSSSSSAPGSYQSVAAHPELAYRYPPPLPTAAVVAAYHLQQQLQQQPPQAPAIFRPPAAPVPKESASAGVKRRGGPGGLNKVCGVSPELQVIVGEATMPRTQIVKQLWAYIRKNNLQDPSNKRKIICNDELRVVFETDSTDMFKMNKLLAKHIIPLERTKDEDPDSKRLKSAEEVAANEPDKSQYPMVLSSALGNFFGTEEREMLQSEALRRLWDYIKANRLEDSVDGSILCDSKLQELFGCESLTASALPEMLAHHLHKQS